MKTWHGILLITITLGLVFLLGYTNGRSKGDRASHAVVEGQKREIKRYIVLLDSTRLIVAEKDMEISTQHKAIKNGEIEREELRNLNIKKVAEITRLKAQIDTLLQIQPNDSITFVDTCGSLPRPAMLLPFEFTKKDEWLDLKGRYNVKGDLQLSLKMDIPLDVWTGVDRDTKEFKTVVTTPNSYVNILDIRSQKFDIPKPKKWGVGFQVGYGVSVKRAEFSPFIGFGLSRNLIRF